MAQGDFTREFGFLPPELVFKTHQFVSAFHDTYGSGWLFVRKSMMRSANSKYLSWLERRAVAEWKLMQVTVVGIVLFALAAFIFNVWFLIGSAVLVVAVVVLLRRAKFYLVQERTLIIAMEMLASDFKGWGALFPKAREQATKWLTEIGFDTQTKLMDTYALLTRPEVAETFEPSPETHGRALALQELSVR